jgi:hypothetical protein
MTNQEFYLNRLKDEIFNFKGNLLGFYHEFKDDYYILSEPDWDIPFFVKGLNEEGFIIDVENAVFPGHSPNQKIIHLRSW